MYCSVCNKVCHYFIMFSSGTFSSLSQISAGLSKMWTRKHTKRYGKSLFCHHKCLALFQKHVNKQVKKGSFMVVFPFFMIVGWVPAACCTEWVEEYSMMSDGCDIEQW